MKVHKSAEGYEAASDDYVAGRPGYPPETVDWLRNVLRLQTGKCALEVGAGTGKFIPILEQTGADIIALEPIEGMRNALARVHPYVTANAGSASDIPLPKASINAVVCAQSFHWFSTSEAIAEMVRVLTPNGHLGLVWNVRDESVPWVAELSEITDRFDRDTPRHKSGAWRAAFPARGLEFVGQTIVPHVHIGSPEQVIVQRTLSTSFVAALPASSRAAAINQVRALIARTDGLDAKQISFPYETRMYAYRKRSGA